MQDKVIWFVSIYSTPPEFDTHLRHQKFAKYLTSKGYKVLIITGSIIHNKQIDLIPGRERYKYYEYDGLQYVHIKTNSYKESNFKRIFSIFLFSCRLYFNCKKFQRPDIIVHNLHVPFDALVYFVARKLKAKYVTEVWDLWPESFLSMNFVRKNNPCLKIAYSIEKWLYKKADKIIFTMEGAKDYLVKKRWDKDNGGPIDMDKYVYINNGVDLHEFDMNKLQYKLHDEDLENENLFKVVYLGSIRFVNNLKLLIDAAMLLKDRGNLKFLIFGDGDERKILEQYCRDNTIENVLFKEKWVNIKYVPYILSSSSLNILNYTFTKEHEYGGSQGKLFQYLASGKPIVANQWMNYSPIDKWHTGISKNIQNSREYARAIIDIMELDKIDYETLGHNAREASKEYDYSVLSEKMFLVLKSLEN